MPNALSSLLGQSDLDYARSLQNARRRTIPSALRDPEQGLQGGFHLGEVGGMPINLTDIVPADLGVNSLAKLMGFEEAMRVHDGWAKGSDLVFFCMRRDDCRFIEPQRKAA